MVADPYCASSVLGTLVSASSIQSSQEPNDVKFVIVSSHCADEETEAQGG